MVLASFDLQSCCQFTAVGRDADCRIDISLYAVGLRIKLLLSSDQPIKSETMTVPFTFKHKMKPILNTL